MARLNYEDILSIYKDISLDYTASQISFKMRIHPSTLYRLIKNNISTKTKSIEHGTYKFLNCMHMNECKKIIQRCPLSCDRFEKYLCPQLLKFPFICDFCEAKGYCKKERHFFHPDQVYLQRQNRLKDSRSHLSLSKKQLSSFDEWISPLIKQKLSIEVIHSKYSHLFPVSVSTVRRWINQSQLSARRIDFLRSVTFKAKKEYVYRRPYNDNPLAKFGHTYQYFLDFINSKTHSSIMELDTVHGLKTEAKKLLTLYHRQSHLQLGIMIPNLYPSSVARVLTNLQASLGVHYNQLFDVILADNGVEFDDLMSVSFNQETGEILSNVFYTRPYNSGDKGGCERNHELFRYIVPKGHALSDLMQEDINYMFSMINSYPRESLNWKTPIDVFLHLFSKDILDILNIKKVPLDEINFKR